MAGPLPPRPTPLFLRLTLVLTVLIGLVLAGEHLYRAHVRQSGEESSLEALESSRVELRSRFEAFQQETRAAVEAALERMRGATDLTEPHTFELLASGSRVDISLELRNARKEILAWSGNRGPVIDTALLGSWPSSFVLQGPIYSYLVVSLPFVAGDSASGLVVGKRLFDVTFPINNRFISSTAFTSTFTSQLKLRPEFRFPAQRGGGEDTSLASVALDGIDGKPIGSAMIARPTAQALEDGVHRTALQILGVLTCLLSIVVSWGVVPPLLKNARPWVRGLVWTALIWTLRYLLVWMEIPGSLLEPGIFDPIYFASPFGFGLAKSLGDVFLSSLAVFLNIVAIALPPLLEHGSDPPPHAGKSDYAKLLSGALLALLLFMLLRGLVATIHSAVFDSSLSYNDPSTLLPSSEVALMLFALFLLTVSLVLLSVWVLLSMHRMVRRAFPGISAVSSWGAVAAALLILSGVFGTIYAHSLLSQGARAAIIIFGVLLSAWLGRALERGLSSAGMSIAVAVAAIALLIPPLDAKVHELDRNHVELMAREILRPVDTWLSFVMNRSLDEVAQGEAARILQEGDRDDVEKLAFTQWAKSILSREGNDCSVTFVDAEGSVVSDFHIGVAQQWFRRHPMDEMPRSNRFVEVDDRSEGGGIMKWYRGYTPVYNEDSLFLGGVWVDLSGGNQRMLRGESEGILRNSSREDFANHHRKLYFFEYFDDELVGSSVEGAPLHSALPAGVAVGPDSSEGVWIAASIGAREYEMYFVPDGTSGRKGSWIALGLEELGLRWHAYSFLRYALFFLLTTMLFLAGLVAVRVFRGERPNADFRTKLLVAFLVVSLIPLVILAYTNRVAATDRATESTERELARQTLAVTGALERTLGAGTPALVARISDEQCEELAEAMEIDFNVYRVSGLQATSKPEMFMAELLDHSLSANAYVNVVLQRKSFFAEQQTIGSLPYIVGYRPILAENAKVIGVVSVPTLFSRNEVESELTQKNAVLYGAYALALILSLVVGSLFASQIASPVKRLKRATAELARGNMDVTLRRSSGDELGDLEDAFAQMTSDLKRTQEQMLKAQKELAWREMAQQVAHEIKNPLTPMKLSVQHLRQAYRDNVPEFADVLARVSGTVLDQIDALSRIASEFSNFARMPVRKPEPVDVHEILQEAKDLFHAGGLLFEMRLAASGHVVFADREELRRAFINVIRNSVQAMGERGTISIDTDSGAGRLTVRLHDTGPGIPEEIRGRLFEPNFSTKTDGMGLGLTIVRATVENLGGTIGIDSAPGGGTSVTMTIPLVAP